MINSKIQITNPKQIFVSNVLNSRRKDASLIPDLYHRWYKGAAATTGGRTAAQIVDECLEQQPAVQNTGTKPSKSLRRN
jgi:hypothetical protein